MEDLDAKIEECVQDALDNRHESLSKSDVLGFLKFILDSRAKEHELQLEALSCAQPGVPPAGGHNTGCPDSAAGGASGRRRGR